MDTRPRDSIDSSFSSPRRRKRKILPSSEDEQDAKPTKSSPDPTLDASLSKCRLKSLQVGTTRIDVSQEHDEEMVLSFFNERIVIELGDKKVLEFSKDQVKAVKVFVRF